MTRAHIDSTSTSAPDRDTSEVVRAIGVALEGRHLLDHPFYRRWEAGEVSMAELADYAAQYRHFEAALPSILESIAGEIPEGRARDLVLTNLAEERGVPEAHTVLFESFARAVGSVPDAGSGTESAVSPAMTALLSAYENAVSGGPAAGVAALVAYESQSPAVAASKGDGLRRHYGVDGVGTRFWDVHAQMDVDHAEWAVEALATLGADSAEVENAARAVADAWWSFLDEREAAAA